MGTEVSSDEKGVVLPLQVVEPVSQGLSPYKKLLESSTSDDRGLFRSVWDLRTHLLSTHKHNI